MLIVIFIVIFCLVAWWYRLSRFIPMSVERHVVNVMANIDDGDFSEEEKDETFYDPKMKRGRFQARLVCVAKAEFGLLPRSQANKLMVRKFLRDYMRERGMRPTHIVQHLDVSVALVFIPSEQDVIAHQLGASKAALDRDRLINTLWYSAYGYFGRMLGFKSD
jgi:hypothetical protein